MLRRAREEHGREADAIRTQGATETEPEAQGGRGFNGEYSAAGLTAEMLGGGEADEEMAARGFQRFDLGGHGADGGGVAGREGDDDGFGVLTQQTEEEAPEGLLQGKSTACASPTVP